MPGEVENLWSTFEEYVNEVNDGPYAITCQGGLQKTPAHAPEDATSCICMLSSQRVLKYLIHTITPRRKTCMLLFYEVDNLIIVKNLDAI